MAALFVRDVELDGGVCFTGTAEAPSVYLDHRHGHPPAQARKRIVLSTAP